MVGGAGSEDIFKFMEREKNWRGSDAQLMATSVSVSKKIPI